jgi:hypothetical protein
MLRQSVLSGRASRRAVVCLGLVLSELLALAGYVAYLGVSGRLPG